MLPFGIEPPRWLQEEVSWLRESGERSTNALTQSLFAGAQLGMQRQQQQLGMASGLLDMQAKEQGIALNKINIETTSRDLELIPQWLKEHPTWESRQTSDWPTAMSTKGQAALDAIRINDAKSGQAKMVTSDIANFSESLNGIDPEARAAIRAMPLNPDGSPSAPQWKALSDARAKSGLPPVGAPKPPASVAVVDEILASEQQAIEAERTGDKVKAQQLRDRAALLRESGKGTEVVTGYDDQGRPIIRMGKNLSTATVATQSQAQQKLLRYENTIQLLNHLDNRLKPEHLGAVGVTGEWLMDRGMSQLFPELANKERIDARSTLIAAREGLMREISNDPRFNNADREEISKALPSSGIFESLPDAKQRIDSVRNIITERARIYSKGLGQQTPVWAMTKEEIIDSYQKGTLDKQTALDALVKFH